MTKQVIESILAPIRALIMKSRPAYKDYLGEEIVEEKKVLVSGEFGSIIESDATVNPGETYLVTIDGVEQEMVAQDMSFGSLFTGDPPSYAYGFADVDYNNTIYVGGDSVFGYFSRYGGKTVSLFRNGTLLADGGVMEKMNELPSLCEASLTLRDDTFTGYVEEDTYTVKIGDEEPIRVELSGDNQLFSPEVFNQKFAISFYDGKCGSSVNDNIYSTFSIAQKVQTTKKKYDIKLLPEELLPERYATKSETASKNNPVFTGSFSQNRRPNTTIGDYSHAEGSMATASGDYSHAEGNSTTASGYVSHAEGRNTTARGYVSHAEGYWTIASSDYSHAEGNSTTASGYVSHAEGSMATASGNHSHAEGSNTTASGDYSHAEGYWTIAQGLSQHVQGRYNIPQGDSKIPRPSDYLHIVGNGSSDTSRSNCHTLDRSGNAWFAGDVYVGSTSGKDKDNGSKKLATKEYVDSKLTLISPNGKKFKITVDDTGAISATEVTT